MISNSNLRISFATFSKTFLSANKGCVFRIMGFRPILFSSFSHFNEFRNLSEDKTTPLHTIFCDYVPKSEQLKQG